LPAVRVAVTGIGGAAARRTVARELEAGRPGLVVMAGFCGALRDGLAVGDVLTPAEVVDDAGNRWACAGSGRGRLLTTTELVAGPGDKRKLGREHGADIVDMESAAVAAACRAAGVPFRSVRVVSDTVDTALAPELVRLFSGGRLSIWKVLRLLLRKPRLLGEFRRLDRDTRLAARNLAAALVTRLGDRGG
jgi:adenosylhomocysteine nucleosidase